MVRERADLRVNVRRTYEARHSTPDFKVGNKVVLMEISTLLIWFCWCIWNSETITLPKDTMYGLDSLGTNIPKKRRRSTCEIWW